MARLQVYFDGDCPACSRDMARCRAVEGADAIEFLDINRNPTALARDGVSYEQALARLHVRDASGRLHKGVAAYALLFAQLPRYRWLARVIGLPGLRPLLDGAYGLWARTRFRLPGQHSNSR